jgi:enterochelin esterase-like enzyme
MTAKRAAVLVLLVASCSRPRNNPAPSSPSSTTVVVASASPSSAPALAAAATLSEVTWHYAESPLGPSDVVVLAPAGATRADPLPVLVAFHGRGESLKGAKLGARGWVDDYAIGTAVRRLAMPPLTREDLLGFVTEQRLRRLNAALSAHSYRGLIVVCPYLPDVLRGDRAFSEGPLLARFVVDEILPRVYRETPAIGTAKTTAVDGVSLGGRAALLVGLLRPEAFRVVAALQPALDNDETARFSDLAKAALTKNPDLHLRLLTSDGDYFLEPTLALGRGLDARHVPNQVDVVTGPHSYDFNRGPGSYEMLLFHDRALRGQDAP